MQKIKQFVIGLTDSIFISYGIMPIKFNVSQFNLINQIRRLNNKKDE